MPQIYDPETAQFPLADPQLRLSVSHEKYSPETGLKVPLSLYVETFSLGGLLTAENTDDQRPARYSLFTNKLEIPGTLPHGKVGFSITGAAGNATNRHGRRGGQLELFVEDMSFATAERISLQANGGRGYQPSTTLAEAGENGGNGGNGGSVKIIYSPPPYEKNDVLDKFIEALNDGGKRWPEDFRHDIKAFVNALPDIQARNSKINLPSSMKDESSILGLGKAVVRIHIKALLSALGGESHGSIAATLTQAFTVNGGDRGFGTHGSKSDGTNGEHGKNGSWLVASTAIHDEILASDVCFAHPVQCQMLLDQANFLYFVGSLESRAQGVILLERLQRRLEPFASQPHAEPKLWKAYRDKAAQLYTVENGPVGSEPYAILQFRSLYHEASAAREQILSGKDFFGKEPKEVPRGSFLFYNTSASTCLRHLRDVEQTLLTYLTANTDVAHKLADARQRAALCAGGVALNESLMQECRRDITDTARKIDTLKSPLDSAKHDLLTAMTDLDDAIKNNFGVTFEDAVSAMSQVLFTNGNKAMAGLQAASLIYQGETSLVKDDGVHVKKSYLIQKVHDIKGDLKSLEEGYKVLKDHTVSLEDPGGEKLIAAEKEWTSLLKQFRNALGQNVYKKTLERFDTYLSLVEQRNSAVLHYNSALLLLLQYLHKAEQLRLDKVKIVQTEFDSLGAGHAAMRAFLQKIYNDNVRVTQIWLYKAQAAYRFRSLKTVNKLDLAGTPSWKCDYAFLSQVQSTIAELNRDFEESLGQPPQTEFKAKFPLPADSLSDADENGILLQNVEVPRKYHVFLNKYDVRLSAVRFFAVGAKTDDDTLQITLTHTGQEVIVNNNNQAIEFIHKPLVIMFKYKLDKNTVLSDGTVALDTDVYTRVGPFTRWKILILRDDRVGLNKGLDVTGVKEVYLEFDFKYRAMQS